MPRPSVLVFDVNETLSDMAPMAGRFADVGAPGHLATTWFASLLRDGFALAAAGTAVPFAVIGESVLRGVLHGVDLGVGVDEAVEHVMSGFQQLSVHPDVPEGVRALRAQGLRLVTLTNGSTSITEGLLERAGLRDEFEHLLSVESAGTWKPTLRAYEYAAATCGVTPAECMLVAVHPWDIDGAERAGMSTAWIDRNGAPYPAHMRHADVVADGLTGLAERLRETGAR
ncbi:2-haloacid dehalogenase [Kineococcus xinjiangensis]|uniref:2-haloacid dehalogenase n=1 Tax=Kineococcus xinjiangensis TaxID=512762 RepID=A0A2S6ICZ5_9ACTN|nr:haloacid dehalogenase type II [Kineococcus xinjiangensis]PPK92092.1 2-haloacid dehalogenase [Kineococcus xinjiangensis]